LIFLIIAAFVTSAYQQVTCISKVPNSKKSFANQLDVLNESNYDIILMVNSLIFIPLSLINKKRYYEGVV